MGSPQILICGESGGRSRFNDDAVVSRCDLLAERDAKVYVFIGRIAKFASTFLWVLLGSYSFLYYLIENLTVSCHKW